MAPKKKQQKADNDPRIRFTVDGRKYNFALNDFTAIEARDFRSVTGMALFQGLSGGQLDIDMIAALVWLKRRKTERTLTYEDVAESLTFGSVDLFPEDDAGSASEPDTESDDPEA